MLPVLPMPAIVGAGDAIAPMPLIHPAPAFPIAAHAKGKSVPIIGVPPSYLELLDCWESERRTSGFIDLVTQDTRPPAHASHAVSESGKLEVRHSEPVTTVAGTPKEKLTPQQKLFKAVRAGDYDKVDGLLLNHKKEIDLDQRDADGETALTIAVSRVSKSHYAEQNSEQDWLPLIKLLSMAGASAARANRDGETPVTLAIAGNHAEIAGRLLAYGLRARDFEIEQLGTAVVLAASVGATACLEKFLAISRKSSLPAWEVSSKRREEAFVLDTPERKMLLNPTAASRLKQAEESVSVMNAYRLHPKLVHYFEQALRIAKSNGRGHMAQVLQAHGVKINS